jgi:hypothetical protein
MKPGWAARIELNQYWIHLTLYQPINERWKREAGKDWSRGELINDGIVKRGVTVEATTRLGRRAMQIVEALHTAHPLTSWTPQRAATGIASGAHSHPPIKPPASA